MEEPPNGLALAITGASLFRKWYAEKFKGGVATHPVFGIEFARFLGGIYGLLNCASADTNFPWADASRRLDEIARDAGWPEGMDEIWTAPEYE